MVNEDQETVLVLCVACPDRELINSLAYNLDDLNLKIPLISQEPGKAKLQHS